MKHATHLTHVLETLRQRKLYAKFNKCTFWLDRITFLSHIISTVGVSIDPSKVKAVTNWSQLTDASEVRSFLGLVRYYCRFIKGFSNIVAPLTWITTKGAKFLWDTKCEESFLELKCHLTFAPLLIIYDSTGRLWVYCDAWRLGLGCMLIQHGRVVAYGLR